MSDGGIGRGFRRLAGHVRELSNRSKGKETPPSTPRAYEKQQDAKVTFHSSTVFRQKPSEPLSPRSVAASKPADEESNDVPSPSMSSSAPPAQHEQSSEDWLKEVLDNLAPEEDSQPETGNPDSQPTPTTTTATDTPKPNWAPPPVRATIIIQPDREKAIYARFDGDNFTELDWPDPSVGEGMVAPETAPPTIGTSSAPSPTPSTTTTTTTTTTAFTAEKVSDNLPTATNPDEFSKEDFDNINRFDEPSFAPEEPQTPTPPTKPANLKGRPIPRLNLSTLNYSDAGEKAQSRNVGPTRVNMFPEFKKAQIDQDSPRKPRTPKGSHARTGSDQQGNEPVIGKKKKKIVTHRRIVTDLPMRSDREAPQIGNSTPRTPRAVPSESAAPVSPRKKAPKPLPSTPRSKKAALANRTSAKPSDPGTVRPDVHDPFASVEPTSPRVRDDLSTSDPSRGKPGEN